MGETYETKGVTLQRGMKILAASEPWSGCVKILIRQGTSYATNLVMFTPTPTEQAYAPKATLTLEREQAQQLMDSLWDCGLRPSEGSGSAGALAATQRHLDDMRKLVFEIDRGLPHAR